ncbi:Uncharacterised protein [Serratia proteamaculans]|uniref:phage tail protein n=1 Tax=Serratia proteamaculans TaxID=28151 RepID=UPI0021837547|nr:phage tail protein [Serratia proteamaculans]CAI2428029.1 Uncharacterised protein [Serratia proteamaculans]
MKLLDLDHYIGGDIGVSSDGDLQGVSDTLRGQQRVLRRLLTNPRTPGDAGDYIFHGDYGAGLPKRVGELANIPEITALIRGQIALEAAVAKSPAPVITVRAITNGIAVSIRYTDAQTLEPVFLSFDVSR